MGHPIVIAECCGNHMGDFEIASKMISTAAACGANVVKFQKRCPRECVAPEIYNKPHPTPYHSFGATYGEHREALEFSIQQHKELWKLCKKSGVEYSTSVWDVSSAKEVVRHINPSFLKIPSACNNNKNLLDYVYNKYAGDVHISLGMSTQEEKNNLYELVKGWKAGSRTTVYACTSGYPVPFERLYLKEITKLTLVWEDDLGAKVGFSGHHLGIAVDIAAYVLGARYIERHFTLDRTWKGTDQAASLEPTGLSKLCRDLKATYAALQYRPDEVDPIELPNRLKLKYKPSAN